MNNTEEKEVRDTPVGTTIPGRVPEGAPGVAVPAVAAAGGPPAGPGGPGGPGGPKGKPVTKGQIGGLIGGLILGIIIYLIPIPGLEFAGHAQLALTLLALVWWATSALPAPITAAIYMGATIVFNIAPAADVFGAWYRGCNTWIVIAAFLIAAAVERTGLGRRIAYAISTMNFIKSYKSMIAAITVLNIVLALIIPSAFARTFLILVIVEEICIANSVNEYNSKILKFAVFAISVPTMTLFLTAEAAINSIIASALGGVSWIGWFFQMGIPSLVLVILSAVLFAFMFKPEGEVKIDVSICRQKLKDLGSIKPAEAKCIVWLIILLAFWFSCDALHIRLETGTFFITALMFIPGIGCINMGALESIPLGTLIFVTCTVAIGTVGGVSGLNGWIATTLLPSEFIDNPILIVLFIAIICMVIHWIIGSVMATVGVITPILLAFASTVPDVSAAVVLYVGFHVISGQYLLSMHQATLATGMEKAGFTDKMVLRMGLPLIVLVLIQSLIDLGWFSIIGIA